MLRTVGMRAVGALPRRVSRTPSLMPRMTMLALTEDFPTTYTLTTKLALRVASYTKL